MGASDSFGVHASQPDGAYAADENCIRAAGNFFPKRIGWAVPIGEAEGGLHCTATPTHSKSGITEGGSLVQIDTYVRGRLP